MNHKPNFFLVGAPKCGTTAMSEYLRTHPNVFMSKPKEPNFFSTDTDANNRTPDQYLALFADADPEQIVIAEASTSYIHSQVALPKISQFNPDARIMVMLRRPTDLVYAIHGESVLAGIETETDFEKAWNLQKARAAGAELPPACPTYRVLQYQWMASIGSQVEKLLQIFPRTQVHIALLDDLAADPRGEYLRLLSFLGLPDDGRTEFPRVNEATSHNWLWLGQVAHRLRRQLDKAFFVFREKTGLHGTGLLRLLDYFNTEKRSRPPLSPEFRRYLDGVFDDEVRLLEELLSRDLSSWRSDPADRNPVQQVKRENVSTG